MVGRITVTKARRILGEMAASLNDVEIQEMLDVLELMAADILQYNSSKEEENSNGIITSESED
jgi:predicted metal-dependent hydrolase